MSSHRPLGMRPIYLTTDAHAQVTLPTEKLVLALLVVGTIPEIQDGLLADGLSIMLARYLILMMLEIAFLAEICLLGQAEVGRHHVRTFLTDYFLK